MDCVLRSHGAVTLMPSDIRVRLRFGFHEIEIHEGATTLGRDDSCTITLVGDAVSREHARIDLRDGRAVLHDLGSRNGVYVNARRITEPTELSDGARIRIGTHELVAQIGRPSPRSSRITGRSLPCAGCGELFSIDRDACPACGRSFE